MDLHSLLVPLCHDYPTSGGNVIFLFTNDFSLALEYPPRTTCRCSLFCTHMGYTARGFTKSTFSLSKMSLGNFHNCFFQRGCFLHTFQTFSREKKKSSKIYEPGDFFTRSRRRSIYDSVLLGQSSFERFSLGNIFVEVGTFHEKAGEV